MGDDPVNLNEFEEFARRTLPKMHYDYFSGGAEDEITLQENIEAFRRIMLCPTILIDVRRIDMSTTILGFNISAPIMIGPIGAHKLAHPQGEVATAKVAAACNTIMVYHRSPCLTNCLKAENSNKELHFQVLSSSSNCTIEEVAASSDAVRFFQLTEYKAIVLTADTPKFGRREADIKNKMPVPKLENIEGLLPTEIDQENGSNLESLHLKSWILLLVGRHVYSHLVDSFGFVITKIKRYAPGDVAWLKSITKLPILIKGVLTAEDAMKAVEERVEGIIVSNHGGRQLNYSPASISILEEVVKAVAGAIPVLFDGGVRRGTDVFKALALGARAALIGRPVVYGLAAKGEGGVRRVIGMLKEELELTMALTGCPAISDITRSHVQTQHERLRSNI